VTAPSITCPQCGWISYNFNDIKEKYCGHCHLFHGVMGMSYKNTPKPELMGRIINHLQSVATLAVEAQSMEPGSEAFEEQVSLMQHDVTCIIDYHAQLAESEVEGKKE
jgi:hypothetical protein